MNIEQSLAAVGYGHRHYANTRNTGKHEVFDLATGEAIARYDAHQAAAFVAARKAAKPALQVIFENQHYQACELRSGNLVVCHKRKNNGSQGRQLVGPQAAEWIEAIKTAIDRDEASALCRAILHS
ncbi:hypothetical protein [Hyphomicrobium sp. DY-1]|uniref:hypothetical protein n=1 Tax=Hyphomicrobium sp. DY-1 TaxID=3075650 RepID=UPI0039C1D18C